MTTCGKRSPSTVPLQSLALLNSEFGRNRAKSFGLAPTVEAGDDMISRLDLAFTIACGCSLVAGRARAACERFLTAQLEIYANEKDPGTRGPGPICARCFWPEMRSPTSSEVAVAVFGHEPDAARVPRPVRQRPRIAGFGAHLAAEAGETIRDPLAPKPPHHPGKAKAVILPVSSTVARARWTCSTRSRNSRAGTATLTWTS